MTAELRGYDPGKWGHSLANALELLVPLLDAAGAKSVVEVGAYAGDLTRELLDWAAPRGARVAAIDPKPAAELERLAADRPDLDLIRERSLDGLARIPPPDAVIVDGDHNYYTVSEELRTISNRVGEGALPLLLFHDVCWPHARRDAYYSPEDIPPEGRQEMVEGAGLAPWSPGIVREGIPYKWAATQEGGPRNGVLTAVEDFVAARAGTRFAVVAVFFGVGVAWSEAAPWAAEVERLVAPWDRHPILERMEANRVHHLVGEHARHVQLQDAHVESQALRERVAELESLAAGQQEALAAQRELLASMRGSGAIRIADWLSRLRHPRHPFRWREAIGRAIGAAPPRP